MLFADTYDFHELLCAPYPDPIMKDYPELSPLQQVTSAIPSLIQPGDEVRGQEASIDGHPPQHRG